MNWTKIFGELGSEFGIEWIVQRMMRPGRVSDTAKPMADKANSLIAEGKLSEAMKILSGLAAGFGQEDEQSMFRAEIRLVAFAVKKGTNPSPAQANELIEELDDMHDDQKEKVRLYVTDGSDPDVHLTRLVELAKMDPAQRKKLYTSSDLTRRSVTAQAKTEVLEWLQSPDPDLQAEVTAKQARSAQRPGLLEAFGINFKFRWPW